MSINLNKFSAVYLFLFAFLIRIAFLLGTYQDKEQVPYFEDVGIAINLLEGIGYAYNFSMVVPNLPPRPTAAKPPMYPLLVALVFYSFGVKNFFALFIVHALLSSFTCAVLFLAIAKSSYNTAIIAGITFAVYLPFIHHSVSIPESTTLLIFLIAIFCYELMNVYEYFTQIRWVLASITSGILAMTEPVTVPFIFFTFLYIAYIMFGNWKKKFIEVLIVAFILAISITPWTIRNYLVFQQFVFLKSNFGSSLKDSMYRSGIRLPESVSLDLRQQVEGMDEVSEDRAVKRAMLSWIAENPNIYLRLLPKNFTHFWWATENYKTNHTIKYIFGRKLPYILLLVCSIPAMLWKLIQLVRNARLSIKVNVYHNIMLILIFMYTIVYTIVGALLLRYHFPVELGMFIFFAETVLYAINKVPLTRLWPIRPLGEGQ